MKKWIQYRIGKILEDESQSGIASGLSVFRSFRLSGNGVPAEIVTPGNAFHWIAGNFLGGWWLAFTETIMDPGRTIAGVGVREQLLPLPELLFIARVATR